MLTTQQKQDLQAALDRQKLYRQQLFDMEREYKEAKKLNRKDTRSICRLANETPEKRQQRLDRQKFRRQQKLVNETPEQKQQRLDHLREKRQQRLANETHWQKELRLQKRRDYYEKQRQKLEDLRQIKEN